MSDTPARRLRGMTWRHDRAIAPLEACSRRWRGITGVEIDWEARSLQDFETFPLEQLATRYDLIVIDHPHVGVAANSGCIVPFAPAGEPEGSDAYIGPSLESYRWAGQIWALPIDAAAQVQAYRPDRSEHALGSYDDGLRCGQGAIGLPLLPPHNLLSLLTLYHQSGCKLDAAGLDPAGGAAAFALLQRLADLVDPWCFRADPIAVLEAMATPGSRLRHVPITFGYANYAFGGYRANTIKFADLPTLGETASAGSVLGGTGIAVSAASTRIGAATAFARWLASEDVQAGSYATARGQPAHGAAWQPSALDTQAGQFFTGTRKTLEGAWIRPRHLGFLEFQTAAAEVADAALQQRRPALATVADINALFAKSLA